jgi:hypothetical protein
VGEQIASNVDFNVTEGIEAKGGKERERTRE